MINNESAHPALPNRVERPKVARFTARSVSGFDDERRVRERDPYETRVPDGDDYRVGYISEDRIPGRGRKVWAVVFRIVSQGPYFGLPLFAFFNIVPVRKWRTPSSALSIAYEVATGQRAPRDIGKSRPSSFLEGCIFRAAVRAVTKDGNGVPKSTEAQYSRVKHLIELVAGTPKPLMKKKR